MNIHAFKRLLDEYCKAKVLLEFSHLHNYDNLNKRYDNIENKLYEVFFCSTKYTKLK